MQLRQSTYQSETYRAFCELSPTAYHNIIRFFERREEEIYKLDIQEYFELLACYCNALFEVGDYNRLVPASEQLVMHSINYNIVYVNDIDIYQKALFQKAAAHYNLHELDAAIHILKELIKMNPQKQHYQRFLRRCFYRKRRSFSKYTRASLILAFLFLSLMIVLELLVLRHFFPSLVDTFRGLRYAVFGGALATFLAAELYHYSCGWLRVARLIRKQSSLGRSND